MDHPILSRNVISIADICKIIYSMKATADVGSHGRHVQPT
jgi:hypothetical protein